MRARAALLLIASVIAVSACSGGGGSKAAAPTTTTVAPTTTTTTISPAQRRAIKARKAKAQLEKDKTAIRHVIEFLNTSFRTNWQTGYNSRASANYYVWSGRYTAVQCIDFWSKPEPFTEDAILHPETIVATPEWVDTIAGTGTVKPKGRVYSATVDYTVSLANGLYPQKQSQTVHVTVLPDGNAKQFIGCTA
jgi:hypothetical protein